MHHGHIMITMLLYMIIVQIPLYVSTQLHNITTMTLKIHRVTALKISGGNNPQHSSGASQPPRGGSSTPGMAYIQNSPEGLLASLNIVVIFKYLQDALRLQDFHTRDVKRAGGI